MNKKFFCVRVYGIKYFAFADLDRGVYVACSADGGAREKRGGQSYTVLYI